MYSGIEASFSSRNRTIGFPILQNSWERWPHYEITKTLKPYSALAKEFNEASGLLMKSNQIVIPAKMRSKML